MTEESTNTESTETELTPSEPESATDFESDAKKWKALARKNEAQAKANADAARRLAELEEKDKSESQKLAEQVKVAESRAADAELASLRLEVALEKAPEGMTVAHVRKLADRLKGSNREELESDAEEFFPSVSPETKSPPTQKPTARLKSGNNPDKDEVDDDPVLASLTALLGIEH